MTSLLASEANPAAPATSARLPQQSAWRLSLRAEAALVGAIMVLAAGLRLPHLALVPHFTDESWEVLWSLPIVRGESFPLTNFNVFKGALFNYLIAGTFFLVGPSALAARLLVLVVGLLTVLATYFLGRAWGGRVAGLLAATLLAVSPAHILFNSHIAWSNCITPLFTTLGVLALYKGVPGPDARRWRPPLLALSGFCWGLAFQTHPMVAGLLPAVVLYVVWKARPLLRTPWPYLAALAFLLGCANLIAYNVISGPESLIDAQHVQHNYATDQDAAASYPDGLRGELLLAARTLSGAVDDRPAGWHYLLDITVLVAVGLAIAGLVRLTKRGNPLPLLMSASFLILLPVVNPKFGAIIQSRYLMPIVPLLLASSAAFLGSLFAAPLPRLSSAPGPWISLAAILVLVLGPVPTLWRYYDRAFAAGETNERAYRLASLVQQYRRPDEAVVLDEAFGYEVGWGTSEVRAMRYLLAFQDAPVHTPKLTPKRLEDELDQVPSLLVILNGRQLRDYDRLTLEALTPAPERLNEAGLFRLSEKGLPRR